MKLGIYIALAAAICLAPASDCYAWPGHGGGHHGGGGHGGGGHAGGHGGGGGFHGGGGHVGGHGGGIGHIGGMGNGGAIHHSGAIHHGGGISRSISPGRVSRGSGFAPQMRMSHSPSRNMSSPRIHSSNHIVTPRVSSPNSRGFGFQHNANQHRVQQPRSGASGFGFSRMAGSHSKSSPSHSGFSSGSPRNTSANLTPKRVGGGGAKAVGGAIHSPNRVATPGVSSPSAHRSGFQQHNIQHNVQQPRSASSAFGFSRMAGSHGKSSPSHSGFSGGSLRNASASLAPKKGGGGGHKAGGGPKVGSGGPKIHSGGAKIGSGGPRIGTGGQKGGHGGPKVGSGGPRIGGAKAGGGPKIGNGPKGHSGGSKGVGGPKIGGHGPNLSKGNRGSAGPNVKGGPRLGSTAGHLPGIHSGQLNHGGHGGVNAKGLGGAHHHGGPAIQLNRGFVNPNRTSLPGVGGHHHLVKRPHQLSVAARRTSLRNTIQSVRRVNNINRYNSFNNYAVRTGQLGYWPTWYGSYYGRHRSWIRGHNYGLFWSPYPRISWWWNRYPLLSTFGFTPWSLYRTGYAFGYYPYYNPYSYTGTGITYYYNYTQPIVSAPTTNVDQSQLGMQAFDRARQQFKDGAYLDAYNSTSEALKYLPNDVEVHQFRSVVLFALGHYTESAAGLYAILGVSPAWDWATLRGLYPSVDVFTGQLRQLEDYRDAHPNETAPRFVLAYLYSVMQYGDDAAQQLQRILAINPDDKLAAQLLQQLNPDAQVPPQPQIEQPPEVADSSVTTQMLLGTHHATREDGGKYEMTLKEDGTFAWNYTKGETVNKVTGVYALKDNGVLALEMDDGAVMLGQIVPTGDGTFNFYMVGESEGQPPLKFGP